MSGPALLDRIDRIMAELAEVRAELAASMPTASGNGLDASDDLAPDSLLDTHTASARLGYAQDTIQVVPQRRTRRPCRRPVAGEHSAAATAHKREIKRERCREGQAYLPGHSDEAAGVFGNDLNSGRKSGRGGPQGARGFLQVRVSSEDFGARTQLIGAE